MGDQDANDRIAAEFEGQNEPEDVLLYLVATGPLSGTDLGRRAQISVYNYLANAFSEAEQTARNPNMHIETKQVSARTAQLLQALALSLNVD